MERFLLDTLKLIFAFRIAFRITFSICLKFEMQQQLSIKIKEDSLKKPPHLILILIWIDIQMFVLLKITLKWEFEMLFYNNNYYKSIFQITTLRTNW